MKKDLVKIKLHGETFSGLRQDFQLAVKSVGEAIHAMNVLTKDSLYKTLLDNDKKGIKYKVLINGRDFLAPEKLTPDNPDQIKNSELVMPVKNLKTIDIVPVIEGADSDIFSIIVGTILVIAGIVVIGASFGGATLLGGAMIVGGIGLIAAGVINLLSSPPKFEDFREIGGGGKLSYLFNGPANIAGEGGPIPVGYGRVLVGSIVVAASYEVSTRSAKETLTS